MRCAATSSSMPASRTSPTTGTRRFTSTGPMGGWRTRVCGRAFDGAEGSGAVERVGRLEQEPAHNLARRFRTSDDLAPVIEIEGRFEGEPAPRLDERVEVDEALRPIPGEGARCIGEGAGIADHDIAVVERMRMRMTLGRELERLESLRAGEQYFRKGDDEHVARAIHGERRAETILRVDALEP